MSHLRGLARWLAGSISASAVAILVVGLALGFAAGAGFAIALNDRAPTETDGPAAVAEVDNGQAAAGPSESPVAVETSESPGAGSEDEPSGAEVSGSPVAVEESATPDAAGPPDVPESTAVAAVTTDSATAALGFDLAGRAFLGEADAPVTIIELTDYECPFCRRHRQEVLDNLLAEYEGRIRYYSLNFPLTSIHPRAQVAAEAAECAHEQGRFWEYGDAIFASNAPLVPEHLIALAEGLELDLGEFALCLTTRSKRSLVAGDFRIGEVLEVTGTPTFFINGKRLIGARPIEAFRMAIDAELPAPDG